MGRPSPSVAFMRHWAAVAGQMVPLVFGAKSVLRPRSQSCLEALAIFLLEATKLLPYVFSKAQNTGKVKITGSACNFRLLTADESFSILPHGALLALGSLHGVHAVQRDIFDRAHSISKDVHEHVGLKNLVD